MPSEERQHGVERAGAALRRSGDRTLRHDQRKRGNLERFHHRANDMESSMRREGIKQSRDILRDIGWSR